jgi:PAS domain S-box-containing protein
MSNLVLNLDDSEALRYAKTRILTGAGFRVMSTGTAKEALQLLNIEQPSVALLDIHLPDMSGIEVCRRIKSDPTTRNIQVLCVSATGTGDEFEAAALEAGADYFLPEPAAPSVLVAVVRRLARNRQLMRDLEAEVERRQMTEARLAVSEERFDLAFQSGGVGVFDWHIPSGAVAWSAEEERLFGLQPGTFEGTIDSWVQRVHPEDLPAMQALLDSAMRDGLRDTSFVFRIIRPDGSVRWIRGAGRFLYSQTGAPQRMVGFNLDVSEHKRMEEKLRESNEDLQRFAFVASHDLQEPLRMIGSYSQLLAHKNKGKLDADSDQYVGFILDNVERMRNLIEGLLDYSRATHPGVSEGVSTDCNVVVAFALQHLELAISESAAKVTHDELPVVYANDGRLMQVFQNLVSNAIKYRGDKPPEIHIAAVRRGDEWVFSVRDNGIGIPREHHESIFGLFRRLHGASEYPGTGVGLAVARRIVERHGGRMWVNSEVGRGSAFMFTLPAIAEPVQIAAQRHSEG